MALLGRLGRRLLPLAVVLTAFASLVGSRPATAAPATPEPKAYISVDADRGCVLAAKNEHQPQLTASTVKLLTALAALERVPINSMVPVSARAANQPANKINMHAGEIWKFDDALHSLLIVSANDAAFAIAERAGGTVENFAKEANETAKRLGATDTAFGDPAGLDGANAYAGGSRMSAYDLSVIARNALATPEIANTSKLLTYDFTDPTGAGRHLVNHNKGFLTTYGGATGLKTGFTDRASRTLVTSATRNGRTMIAVVMGTWDDTGWAGFLLDQAFASPATAACSGAKVPPVRAVTADARLTAFKGLPSALGLGAAGSADVAVAPADASVKAATTTPTHAASSTTETKKRATPSSTAQPAAVRETSATRSASSGTTFGFLSLRNLAIGIVVALALLFVLRRRAVRRQRARRIARQKRMAEIRRRRMIDLVDPTEVVDEVSHVKVVPTQRNAI